MHNQTFHLALALKNHTNQELYSNNYITLATITPARKEK